MCIIGSKGCFIRDGLFLFPGIIQTEAKCKSYCVVQKKQYRGKCKEMINNESGERESICECIPYVFRPIH